MKIYVILFWCWEGDGRLVNSFIAVTKDYSKENIKETIEKSTGEKINRRIYYLNEKIPGEFAGGYRSPGFYQVIEREI
jgi:hypothetical protein